jgi:hypothetical protein
MATYAVVNASNVVTDLVQWDGVSPYSVSPSTLVLAGVGAAIGGTYLAGVFTPPAPPAVPTDVVYSVSPATGATVTLPNAAAPWQKMILYLTPATLIAALTIQMPPSPQNGDALIIVSTKTVTLITYSPAVANAPATIALGSSIRMTYSAILGLWIPW